MPDKSPRMLLKQKVPTRDQVELCTDVYLPKTNEPGPTVVVRTPYGRSGPFFLYLAQHLNRAGFALAIQDCRGRYDSGGKQDWRRETDDGYDTLVWLQTQSWCDGKIGLLGLSTAAHSCIALAARQPPEGIEIGAMINMMGAADFHSLFYRNGALVLHWSLPWLHMMGAKQGTGGAWRKQPWNELFRTVPLTQVPEGDQFDLSPWREVLAHPAEGDFWKDLDASPLLADVGVPTLHLSGWYDLMLNQTLLSYEGMVAGRGRAKGRQKLVIGPWHHQSLFSWTPGRPGGGKGGQKVPDVLPLIGAWLEKWLGNRQRSREAAKKLQQVPDVSLYVMAADQWLGSDRFPCPKSHTMDWYLTAGGDADCEDRGGGLVKQPPEQAGRDTFRYDPEDPVPTLGGSIWPLPAAKLNPGRQDQSPAEQRSDVVLYSSPPLEEDLLVVGRLTVELWATSSAGETDFTAKLVDVDSEGVPRIVQDGIVRCRFQRSRSSEPPPAPEEPHCFHLDLQATGHCFHRGHRLRLEISSSNFPKFDRNLNTTEPLHTASAGTTAQQTTFHGGRFTSRIRLPVIRSKYLKKHQRDPFKALSGAVAGGGLGKIRAYYHFGKNRWKGKLLELLSSQFGKPAGVLGGLVGRVLAHYNREINLWTIAMLEIESDDHVLEIGFGPGMAVQKAAEIAAEGYVAGIDYSEVMVRQARKRNATAIGEGRVELIHGSAMELPYNADSFDKIYAVNSVQVWPDRLVVMKQLRRILKPGGLVALTLQPRWVKGEKAVREIGREIVADLDAAEFSQTRMEFIQTKMEVQGIEPVPCICALGVKQAHPVDRDEPPAGDRG